MQDLENFTEAEKEVIFSLAEAITGTCQSGKYRRDILTANVARRMYAVGKTTLRDYIKRTEQDPHEYAELVSALTIHTTSWFREKPHFARIERHIRANQAKYTQRSLSILCCACSSGEEVYSLALMLEEMKTQIPKLDYIIEGLDIDPVSVQIAARAIYAKQTLEQIDPKYRKHLLMGSGKTAKFFTLAPTIRQRCKFSVKDISRLAPPTQKYSLLICRNVLIYFTAQDVAKIVPTFLEYLETGGILCLGHSESIDPGKFGLKFLGDSMYGRKSDAQHTSSVAKSRRVLVVDDSPTVRKTLEKLFERAQFKVFSANSAIQASELLRTQVFDLITLDLHMPEVDGHTWLIEQRSKGLRVPVVVVSDARPDEASNVLGALGEGAQDYIEKNKLNSGSEEVLERLRALIESSCRKVELTTAVKRSEALREIHRPQAILIGASTGGTETLTRLLKMMPSDAPPVIVAQHIAYSFARPFAERLAVSSKLCLGKIHDGEKLQPGHIYLAIGDHHIGVRGRGGNLQLVVSDAPPINRHRPSVDFLFKSAADNGLKDVFGVILTGMGYDGANGLSALRGIGATTFAQDEQSCVVFGMPKEAIRMGAAAFIGNPEEIRNQINTALKG